MPTERERKAMVKRIRATVKYFNYLTDEALRLDLLTTTHVDDHGNLILTKISRNYHEED